MRAAYSGAGAVSTVERRNPDASSLFRSLTRSFFPDILRAAMKPMTNVDAGRCAQLRVVAVVAIRHLAGLTWRAYSKRITSGQEGSI